LAFVDDRDPGLTPAFEPPATEFVLQTSLINGLQQPRPHLSMDLNGRADHLLRQWLRLTHGYLTFGVSSSIHHPSTRLPNVHYFYFSPCPP